MSVAEQLAVIIRGIDLLMLMLAALESVVVKRMLLMPSMLLVGGNPVDI